MWYCTQMVCFLLESRKQAIVIGDSISDAFPLPWGVPQGSVKGPFDFIMYSAPLSDVINAHHNIHHVIYADDTQLYLTMESTHQSEAVNKLESCISDVRSWAIQNKLMLNDSKTEIIHFHSAFRTNSRLTIHQHWRLRHSCFTFCQRLRCFASWHFAVKRSCSQCVS